MEKKAAHHALTKVKALIKQGKVQATLTAYHGARYFRIYDLEGMCEVVLQLTQKDFYKSMTTYNDHTLWQDVYRPKTAFGRAYIKLMVMENVLIVSFKEL